MGKAARVSHPVFAYMYSRFAPAAEKLGVSEHRAELLRGVNGKVLEVGAGSGLNFAYYPPTVSEVVAIEPEPHLRARAAQAAVRAPVKVTVMDGMDSELPFNDAAFDVVVASLMLCSVPVQRASLAEMHRVLRAGGELRFYEHVVAQQPGIVIIQKVADIFWPHVGAGCHTSRDTLGAIEDAGFSVSSVRRFQFQPCLMCIPASPHIIGMATKDPTELLH